MADPTTCTRHRSVETRLRCSTCDDPICPRCAVDAPVGMRCPGCARPDRSGGLRRRPDQIARAAGVALVGALLGGVVLALLAGTIRFFTLIAAYLIGMQISQRVRAAAGGNTVDVIRALAVGGAVGSVVVGELAEALVFGGGVRLGVTTLLRVGIAAFGAFSAMR